MSFSLMVSTDDQLVVWVSDSFADHVGSPPEHLVGRSILDLLDGTRNESWAQLFVGSGSADEHFDGFGLYLVADAEPIDRFELRSVRYVDDGRKVMISLQLWHADSEWESSEAFVSDVRAALLAGDIYVAYQPIVDIRTGQLKKLEALARWTHPDRGGICPEVFIDWAEGTGVIDELGEWILDRACRDVVQMEADGIDVDLSVNVSVMQLRNADVSQRFGEVMEAAGLAPERVWIEVTESVLLDADALSLLMAVHSLGVRLVIDDFGTGHANFDYLTRLVVDSLKIDTSFVAGLGTESRATAIVRSVVTLGRELGLEIVAEGIETERQRSQLLELNCRLGQGWLFSPALRYDELVARYAADEAGSTEDATAGSPGTDELLRRSALRACRILDTDPEPVFDSLAQLASQLLSVPMAAISFVDTDREWFKAQCGTDLTDIARSAPLFAITDASPEDLPLIVGDTDGDERSSMVSLVRTLPQVRAYAGMPIRSREGLALGTFSVADIRPRSFTPLELSQLALLADQASELLDLRRRTLELDDLYLEARHRAPQGPSSDDLVKTAVDAAPQSGVLTQLARMAGRRAAPPDQDVDARRPDESTSGPAAEPTESRCGTWLHVDYRVVAVDDGIVALLAAHTPDDLIGREVGDFVAPVSQPALRAAREMRDAGIVPGARLVTLLAVDGTERLCLISSEAGEFQGEPAVIGRAREILDAPRLMRQMVSGVVAEVSDAVIVTDPECRVLSWNPAAARLYGWSEQEVLGHTLPTVVDDVTLSHGGASWDDLLRNGSWTGVLHQRARDGTPVVVSSSVNLLRDHGTITGTAVVNRVLPPGLTPAEASGDLTAPQTSIDRPSGMSSGHDVPGSYSALDTSPHTSFDWLTRLAARLIDAPIAAVSLIGRDRHRVVSRVGFEMTDDRSDGTFSSLAIATPDETFVVNDTAVDERFADHPFVTGAPYARSYAAVPICSREGLPIGALSVIDTTPRVFTEQELRFLKVLSLHAETLFDLRRRAGRLDDLFTEPAATMARVRRRALAATPGHTAVDSEASILWLDAARSLLRAEAVEEAIGVVIAMVRDLGGSTIPARLDDHDALPLDCSLGHGEPLLARPDSALARLRIERILPEILDDARETIDRLRERDDDAELSQTDPLTGLLNRRAVDQLVARLGPDDAVIVIDIGCFEAVNDNWGHGIGDELLIAFARALRSNSRAGDHLGRLGADELLAVLVGAGRAGLESFLGRLNETWLTVRPREVTYSAGAALVGQRAGTEALTAADAAMYRAKAMGRDQVALDTTPALPAGTHDDGAIGNDR